MELLLDRFRAHLARTHLFGEPGGAIVAVSGGADSVVLLDLMRDVATQGGLTLTVAHADHGIQAGSRAVGQAVSELAGRYKLPFELGELELGPDTSETVARRARYRWLREVQQQRGARYLVTAHHHDDQMETVRGRCVAAARRAAGIRRVAGMVGAPAAAVRRRSLPSTRRARPGSHDDPANRDPRHARSWVRTELMPLGRAVRRGVAGDVLRLMPRCPGSARVGPRAGTRSDLTLRVHAGGFDVARGVLARYDPTLAAAFRAPRDAGLVPGPLGRGKWRPRRQALRPPDAAPGAWAAETAFDRCAFREGEPALMR
jgi:tRNA(Ile)-lysidine synthetase-like protein